MWFAGLPKSHYDTAAGGTESWAHVSVSSKVPL